MSSEQLNKGFSKRDLLVLLVVGGIMVGPVAALAAIAIVVESVAIECSDTLQSGRFEVFVQSDELSRPDLVGHQVTVEATPGQTGHQSSKCGKVRAMHPWSATNICCREAYANS